MTVNPSSASGLSFGQNNISLAAGVSQTVTISGGNGTYQVSNISNPSAVSAGMSGSGIIVFASAAGTGAIKVCDTSNVCGTLNVTVTPAAASQAVVFSVTNPTLAVGQNLNIAITGGAVSYIVLANSNPDIVQANMTTNATLSLTGVTAGTDSLTVCATGGGGCNPLPVTVTGPATTATVVPATATTVTATPAVAAPVVQPSTAVANTALLAEIQTMQTAVTQVLAQIQSIQSQLNQLEAQVNAGSGITTNTTVLSSAPSGTSNFTELLTLGSQDAQVTALQQQLTALGFYSGPITGYYGSLTEAAVVKYQTAHGIAGTGSLGPGMRTALNAGD